MNPASPNFDKSLRELAHGADVFVYDAQYSPEQLATERKGWGHSTWLEGVKIARECKVRNLILFHHDPDSIRQNHRRISFRRAARISGYLGGYRGNDGDAERSRRERDFAEVARGTAAANSIRGDRQRTGGRWLEFRREGDGARYQPARGLSHVEEPPASCNRNCAS